MSVTRSTALGLVLLALAACSDDDGPTDTVALDSGTTDFGMSDFGVSDLGLPDFGTDMNVTLDAAVDASVDAGTDMPAPPDCVGPPGLYADVDCTVIASDVRPFTPRFQLWSDGADKERFVYLPAGTLIDTSNPDRWGFPMGTRVYKTFLRDGVRLETRIFEKTLAARGVDSWIMRSWLWSEDQRSVTEVGPFGEQNVLGTTHDIPTRSGCIECHSAANDDVVMGFSAIQLAHAGPGVTLEDLVADGWLSDPIAMADTQIPGDATAQAALGYLHANCGNCHGGPSPERGLDLWQHVGPAGALESAPAFTSSVCVCSEWVTTTAGGDPVELRIFPSDSERSVIAHRMGSRVLNTRMPPIASEEVDTDGRALVMDWIDSLASDAGGCPTVCP